MIIDLTHSHCQWQYMCVWTMMTLTQIQDVCSVLPHGHAVGRDVEAVRVASLSFSRPHTYDFGPLFSASCLFCWKEEGLS